MNGVQRHVKAITEFNSYAEYMEHCNSGNSQVDFCWDLSRLKTRLQLLGIKKPTEEDWEKAFQYLVNDITNGVREKTRKTEVKPVENISKREQLEATIDLKKYKEENQGSLF